MLKSLFKFASKSWKQIQLYDFFYPDIKIKVNLTYMQFVLDMGKLQWKKKTKVYIWYCRLFRKAVETIMYILKIFYFFSIPLHVTPLLSPPLESPNITNPLSLLCVNPLKSSSHIPQRTLVIFHKLTSKIRIIISNNYIIFI
jgi:hypothetical protein